LVLFVTDLFHPVDHLAIELFLNGNVRHGSGWRGTVPMFFPGREPDDIARMDLLDGTALALHSPATACDNQGLSKGMGMPCGACTGLEGYTCTRGASWVMGLE